MLFNFIQYLRIRLANPSEIQFFTYFIPAPPQRKSGYREKELDSTLVKLSKLGFHITDINTQSISHAEQPGMWVMAKLIPLTAKAKSINIQDFPFEEKDEPTLHNEEQVEGIYYID